jgi:hypothetical protein
MATSAVARRRAGAPQDPQSGLFWHDQGNGRYTSAAVAWRFVDILRRAEFKPGSGRTRPRLHDLRHSMVVNRILEWNRSGINPQDMLPFLATYLGHRISTPRWSTLRSRRICCRRRVSGSAWLAHAASIRLRGRGNEENRPVPGVAAQLLP